MIVVRANRSKVQHLLKHFEATGCIEREEDLEGHIHVGLLLK